MPVSRQELLDVLTRSRFEVFLERSFRTLNPGRSFKPNWHLSAIAYQLDRVRRGDINRLIINLPPRSLKSIMASVAFPAFVLGQDPKRRIFAISYSDVLSEKHSGDFRSVVESGWYRRAFAKMRIERSLGNEVVTTARGFRKSTTVMGSLTGLGGDIFILDDPQKAVEAQSEARRTSLNNWFSNTLVSRLDSKETGAIIIVMQRVHMDDLCGYVTELSDRWKVLSLPAIAEVDEQIEIRPDVFHFRRPGEILHPEQESLAALEGLRHELGSDVFAAQYQQSPVPSGGAWIRRAWLVYYERHELPERDYRAKIIQSWDTAAKDGAQNDWSVCTTWLIKDGHYFLLDLTRGRYEYPRLRDTAIALADRYKPQAVLIENASTGMALAPDLKPHLKTPVKLVSVDNDKRGRLYVQQAKFEAGLVHFPKGARFLPELEAELFSFPNGKTDDQVDSISQALGYKYSSYADALMRAI
jgi:predicted phage terminase large subunit-like protein